MYSEYCGWQQEGDNCDNCMVIIGIILDLLTINSQNANKLNILSQAYICKSVLSSNLVSL